MHILTGVSRKQFEEPVSYQQGPKNLPVYRRVTVTTATTTASVQASQQQAKSTATVQPQVVPHPIPLPYNPIYQPNMAVTTPDPKFVKFNGEGKLKMTAALKRRLGKGELIKDYYDEKAKLLRQASIPENQIANVLIEGLPDVYKPHFYGKRFQSTSEFLQLVLDIEADIKASSSHGQSKPKHDKSSHCVANIEHCHRSSAKPEQAKPKWPCKYCKQKSGAENFHLHS